MDECIHEVLDKYVTPHGLVCEECLTEADFRRHPGWKERLAAKRRLAAQAKANFSKEREGVQ